MTQQERLARIKDRYLRDPQPSRLGGLAADLARIHSFSNDVRHLQPVEDLLTESEHFIEWMAYNDGGLDLERLAQIQLDLAKWKCALQEVWADEDKRLQLAAATKNWSDEILAMSGLLAGVGP